MSYDCPQQLFEMEIFSYIINVFTVIFNQFNISLMNKVFIYILNEWMNNAFI